MAKILIAGFLHETNTFSTKSTTIMDFEKSLGFPGLIRNNDMFEMLEDRNLPAAGFIRRAIIGHQLIPVIWCSAAPFGKVTQDTFEKITAIICDGIKATANIDAIYLDLHGAMVSEQYDDAEGELLSRIRAIVGYDIPIGISLDLHANVSKQMVDLADVIEIFRTAPHIDMAETGERTFNTLMTLVNNKNRYTKRLIKLPYIIPFASQCTLSEPGLSIYCQVKKLSEQNNVTLSFAMGNMFADTKDCGPSIIAYGMDKMATDKTIEILRDFIMQNIYKFKFNTYSAMDCVKQAMSFAQSAIHPIIIADVQDNANAGGSADTTGILHALIENKAKESIMAILYDPEVAQLAHKSGINTYINTSLGAKYGTAVNKSVEGLFKIIALGNGQYQGTGAYTLGTKFDLGPMALLEISDVQVIISSKKMQAADPALFQHLDINPQKKRILVLKSAINFRADFASIGSEIILAQAPGDSIVDPRQLEYKNLPSDFEILC